MAHKPELHKDIELSLRVQESILFFVYQVMSANILVYF